MATGNVDLSLSGLASGLDWKTLVQQLANAERAPETRLRLQQTTLNQKNTLFGNIKTKLAALQTQVNALSDPALFGSRRAQVSDATIASASASANAALGTFTFNVTQLATASRLNGGADIGLPISSDGNLGAVTIGTAGFSTAVTAGTFTVNGKQITISSTDSLQDVFDAIATATGNNVTASYDTVADKITLTSGDNSEIILGSATDSSNFLQAARLSNNGTGSITSASALGGVRLTAALADADLRTPITAGTGGQGSFKINGETITFNTNTDNVNNILDRINTSAAGVMASYDSQNDRFVLTNKTTGDVGIALEDVSGNFLTATGLLNGAVARGKDLAYTVNGGSPLTSHSNTITEDSSGVSGLSVTVSAEQSVTVTVNSDTDKIESAIQSFVDAYNSVQSYITTQSASSTDSQGVVTAGPLASDRDAAEIAANLRKMVFSPVSNLSGIFDHLADIGIQTNGNDNTLAIKDSAALDSALANHSSDLQSLFADATNGLTVGLNKYLDDTIGDDGSLVAHQSNLTKQSGDIDTQIANMEKVIQADSDRMTAEFIAMEKAQSNMNQQLQFLMQRLGQ